MPISRIKTDGIQDEAVTSAKIGDNIDLDGQFVRVPHGTTAERPGSPAAGYLRFNTDQGTLEQWNTTTNSWAAVDSPPIITSVAYPGSATAADPAGGETITVNGSNFKSGFTLTVGGTTAPTTTFVSSTQITFTTPAKTAGDYDVVVTNTNGLAATSTNGISFNGLPAFTTAAGNVGSITGGEAMTTITIVAAEPDAGTLAYSVTSGALPSGTTIGSANGQITGTPAAPASTTTFNFTVTATDDESQTNSRAFNLIVLRPIYATSIDDSLRLVYTDNSSLTKTWSGNATDGTRGTMSAWVKRGMITNSTSNNQYWFHSGTGADNSGHMDIKFNTTDVISIGRYSDTPFTGTSLFRDISAWLHIVVVWDTTDATASNNKVAVYVNGTALGGTYANISQNDVLPWTKNGNAIYIGKHATVNRPFDGYIADFHLIDGQALSPTDFAEEYNGVWAPKDYSGTYGNNGFKLDFADSSAIGNDVSGNNNDLTSSAINARDVFKDSPTNNFCTYNPLILRRDVTTPIPEFTRGNLKVSYPNAGGNQTYSFGTHGMSSGKWYYEVYMTATGTNTTVGIGSQNDIDANGSDAVIYRNDGSVLTYAGGSKDGDGASYANGDIIGCGFDLDNGTVTFYKNGTLQSTVTGISTTTHLPYARGTTSENNFANFGQDSTFDGLTSAGGNADGNGIGNFKYTVPSGHLAICSKNLSESTISTVSDDRPEDYFNVVTYSGTSAVQSITVGFQPDFTWLKRRDGAGNHVLYDSVRGTPKRLFANTSDAESASGDGFTDFNSTGFDLTGTPSGGDVNTSGRTYVGWNWKAGGAPTATNSAGAGNVPTSGSVMIDGVASTSALAGSIAADKISANTKSGFSIVGYTGTGSNATVAHGLTSAPEMIITKSRTNASATWLTYHSGLGNNTYYITLNSSGAVDTGGASVWNSTSPTSSVFSIGTSSFVNPSSGTMIAYCFHSVEGFSKFGRYIGNGSSNGPFVETGFKPAFVLYKRTDASADWHQYDNKRDPFNVSNQTIFTNGTSGEATGDALDFLSNGFKQRNTGSEANASGGTYIFMAFAEDPFKYSEAR